MGASPQGHALHFSAAAVPSADRLAVWREEFGRKFVNLDIAPLGDAPLHYEATFQMFGAASAGLGQMSSVSCARTRPMIADSNDDILILVPLDAKLQVSQAGQEAALSPGQALVRRSDDPGTTWSDSGTFLTISLPQAALCQRLSDADRLSLTVLPAQSAALSLLVGYAQLLFATQGAGAGALPAMAGAHLIDLASMAIGANRDDWVMAQARGGRAAHLALIQQHVEQDYTDSGLSLARLAARMGLSPAYLRKILASNGQRFSRLLLDTRLTAASRMLQDTRHAARPISQIIYAVGFNDISYFNRTFRTRFGMTPRDMRAANLHR